MASLSIAEMNQGEANLMANLSADGTVERHADHYVLRFKRNLSHPIERVWAALTRPEQLKMWLGDADVDLAEGGNIELRWLGVDENGGYSMKGVITKLDPPHLLEYKGNIHGTLRWELREAGDGCVLNFSSTLSPVDDVCEYMAGWTCHLSFLGDMLNGTSGDWRSRWRDDQWEQAYQHYKQKLEAQDGE